MDVNKTMQVKTAIQQLHIVINDLIQKEGPVSEYEASSIIKEFEKTLSIATTTIDKL